MKNTGHSVCLHVYMGWNNLSSRLTYITAVIILSFSFNVPIFSRKKSLKYDIIKKIPSSCLLLCRENRDWPLTSLCLWWAGARMYRLAWLAPSDLGRQEVWIDCAQIGRKSLSLSPSLQHVQSHLVRSLPLISESRRLTFHRNHASFSSQVSFRNTWCSISEFVFFRFQSDEPLLAQRSKCSCYLNVEQLCTGDAAQFEHVNL